MWRSPRQSRRHQLGAQRRPRGGCYGSSCVDGCVMTASTTARSVDPAAPPLSRSVSTRRQSPTSSPSLNRFTDLAYGTHPPTRDFEKWDGELFAYTRRRDRRAKQNPVRARRTPRTGAPYLRMVPGKGSVCTSAPDIGTAAKCTAAPDISRLPLPRQGKQHCRVAQQPERQRKLEEPVRARPLLPV